MEHVPGKLLYTADALSRVPTSSLEKGVVHDEEVEYFIHAMVVAGLPASKTWLETYRSALQKNRECTQVIAYCKTGWAQTASVSADLMPYWKVKGSLTVCEGLLMFNDYIVIPKSLRQKTMDKIHQGHQGSERCRMRI